MHGKGLEFIPTRLGNPQGNISHGDDYEAKIEALYKRKRERKKEVSNILSMNHIMTLPIKTPSCFSWFETPMNSDIIDTYIQAYEKINRELHLDGVNETYIYRKSPSEYVEILVKLQKNPSGMYNIVSVQCEYSMRGAKAFEDFLEGAGDIGISEDGETFQILCDFWDDVLSNSSGR